MGRKSKRPATTPPIADSKPFDYTLYKSRFLPRIPNAEASVKKETLQTVEGLESSRNDQTMNNPKEERKLGKRKREDEKQEEKEPVAFQFGRMRIDGKLYHASATETGPVVCTPYHQHIREQLEISGPSGKAGMLKAMGIKDPEMMEKKRKKKMKRKASLKKKHQREWKERVESVERVKAERQKMRADNIKARIQEKKMRKIEKREKKLMYPGRSRSCLGF